VVGLGRLAGAEKVHITKLLNSGIFLILGARYTVSAKVLSLEKPTKPVITRIIRYIARNTWGITPDVVIIARTRPSADMTTGRREEPRYQVWGITHRAEYRMGLQKGVCLTVWSPPRPSPEPMPVQLLHHYYGAYGQVNSEARLESWKDHAHC
jgi:hypothetical protein